MEREPAGDEGRDWARAHEALLQLARERGELEGREGMALLRAFRSKVHVHLGHGSFVEYVGRLFGHSPRTTWDKLRTAEALEMLPELDHALTAGGLSWSAARELARVATPQTELDWLEASKGRTVREIERLVAGHERGDRPSDAARPLAVRHVLRFEVAAETLATFRDAMQELRRQSGEHLDDDSALLLMARKVLGSKEGVEGRTGAEGGRASYQLALTICEQCQRGFQDAGGERLEVDTAIVDMARCDAQHIGRVGGLAGTVASSTAGAVMSSESATGASSTRPHGAQRHGAQPHIAQPHIAQPHITQPHIAQPHVGEPETRFTQRATQTIPPALRRSVLCRDQKRCVVPGCRHSTFVDLHHFEPRSEGGQHDAENLVVLCGAHHRAVHRGQLLITGSASTGLRFAHADGTPYGHAPSPHSIAILEQVFRGLRGLGFKEREARGALYGASEELSAKKAAVTAPELLRAALRRLGPRGVAP